MIFADLQDGKRLWKSETRTYSLTSGPRSPTKIEYSGERSSLVARQKNSGKMEVLCLPSISQSASTGPVELELTLRVWHRLTIELQRLGRSLRRRKINEAVAGIAAANSLEIDRRD